MSLAELNLAFNPFGELTPAQRGAVAVGPFDALAAELRVPKTAVQLRGPCGHGKSSHLHGLARALPQARYSRVDSGGEPCAGGIYLMDEADHLGWLRRARYLWRATSVAVATHRDMSGFLRLCGFRVVDVPVSSDGVSHLRRVVARRLVLAWTRQGEPPMVQPAHLQRLIDEHGADLRAVEMSLYDWVAGGACEQS